MTKTPPDYQEDLASIRNVMERSSKFISLSGLSGILAGVFALAGAAAAYYVMQDPASLPDYSNTSNPFSGTITSLLEIAVAVLIASLIAGISLSTRKAKKHNTTFWNETSKRLCINLLIPLLAGGAFILILIQNGYYIMAAPACLLFYGLALVNASANLYEEIRFLGYSEIILGIIAALMPGYGLFFWAIGFGVFHIFYGALMYRKYD
jgi:hypothetical protein